MKQNGDDESTEEVTEEQKHSLQKAKRRRENCCKIKIGRKRAPEEEPRDNGRV